MPLYLTGEVSGIFVLMQSARIESIPISAIFLLFAIVSYVRLQSSSIRNSMLLNRIDISVNTRISFYLLLHHYLSYLLHNT